MAQWDPNDYRIFCGDLGNEVSDELLAKAFRKYSSFQKAKVVRDGRTNRSKGYGFVSFKHQDVGFFFLNIFSGKFYKRKIEKFLKGNRLNFTNIKVFRILFALVVKWMENMWEIGRLNCVKVRGKSGIWNKSEKKEKKRRN